MDSGTLSDESFSTYAKANFELVKIDEAENGVEFEKLGITSVPAVVVLGSDGKEIARITGDPRLCLPKRPPSAPPLSDANSGRNSPGTNRGPHHPSDHSADRLWPCCMLSTHPFFGVPSNHPFLGIP